MRVIGLRAQIVGPLLATSLRITERINVLYGLNGSGKSWTLATLVAALRGLRPEVSGPAHTPASFLLVHGYPWVSNAPVVGPPTDLEPWEGEYVEGWMTDDSVTESLSEALDWSSGKAGWELQGGVESALLAELQRGYAALCPIGAVDGRWLAFLAARPDQSPVAELLASERQWESSMLSSDDEDIHLKLREYSLFSGPWREFARYLGYYGDSDTARPSDGMPLPLLAIGEITWADSFLPSLITDDGPDIDVQTRRAAFDALMIKGNRQGKRKFSAALDRWAQDLSRQANEIYRMLLLDAPTLTLKLPARRVSTLVQQPTWHGGRFPVESLSQAQRRWARISIHIALASVAAPRPLLLVLDEPETALHRTAEEHLATGLAQLATKSEVQIVISSHSPAMESIPDATVQHVRSGAGGTRIHTMKPPELARVTDWGMTASDLLRRWRAFVLVEGRHDEVVLQQILGSELDRVRAHILPVRGASQLHATVDSRFLFDFSLATMVPVVDNIDPGRVTRAWEEALVTAATHGAAQAGEQIRDALPSREAAENKFLSQFLSRAIEVGVESRVVPHAFSKADIIEYLPADVFIPGVDWQTLRERHSSQGGSHDFKKWLQSTYGASFDDDTLRFACRALDEIPVEFRSLISLIEAHTGPEIP